MNDQKLIDFLKWAIAVSHAPAYWVPKAQQLLKELEKELEKELKDA